MRPPPRFVGAAIGVCPAVAPAHSRTLAMPGNRRRNLTALDSSPPWSKAIRIAAVTDHPMTRADALGLVNKADPLLDCGELDEAEKAAGSVVMSGLSGPA